MKKLLFAILLSAVFSFATEMCNPGAATNIPVGWCYSEGYVCYVTTEATGGIRFSLGKDSKCSLTNLERTKFYTFEQNAQGGFNTNDTLWALRLYLAEGAIDNVSALAVAINTAFIINAFNEKIKVRIQYHFVGNSHDINSIRLLGIGKAL